MFKRQNSDIFMGNKLQKHFEWSISEKHQKFVS